MKNRCKISATTSEWCCPEEATTEDGLCIFHDPDLKKDVKALRARIEARLADEKEDTLQLGWAIFPDTQKLFAGVVFKKSVSFYWAKFYGEQTLFFATQFHGERTTFVMAEFHSDETLFPFVQFRSKWTSFELAKFRSRRTFFDQEQFYSQRTSFGGAEFHGKTVFRGPESKQIFLTGTTEFRGIRVDKNAELVFDKVDLSRTEFLHTDLARVKFLNVTWDYSPTWKIGPFQCGSWRSRVYDEALWREARRDPSKILQEVDTKYLPYLGRLYQALKAYYKVAGQHQLVGHFQYGLMEVQWYQKGSLHDEIINSWFRQKCDWLKRKSKKWLSWEAAYKFSSGYGEDYSWAGFILMLLLFLFAACYWWLGVPKEVLSEPWWERPFHALLYSFQTATLGRVNFYNEEVKIVGRYLNLLESVLIPVQLGFFIYALRNRFRR